MLHIIATPLPPTVCMCMYVCVVCVFVTHYSDTVTTYSVFVYAYMCCVCLLHIIATPLRPTVCLCMYICVVCVFVTHYSDTVTTYMSKHGDKRPPGVLPPLR
jgi:hypothetical protein